jgi:hypothetical protein
LIPLYLTILARPAQENPSFRIHPERGVHLKRRLGLIHRRLITRLLPKQAWIRVSD